MLTLYMLHRHWTTLENQLRWRPWTSLCNYGSHSFPEVQLPDWSGKSALAPSSSRSCNNTRWWSEWELRGEYQLLTLFRDVPDSLQNLDACPANHDRLLAIPNSHQSSVDAASPFVRKMYLVKGDGDMMYTTCRRL